jgi:hypothetical protein
MHLKTHFPAFLFLTWLDLTPLHTRKKLEKKERKTITPIQKNILLKAFNHYKAVIFFIN